MTSKRVNHEIKCWCRRVRSTEGGYEWSPDPKHADILLYEWSTKK